MITLAIDTSTPRGAVALLRDDKPLGGSAFDRSQAGQNLFDADRHGFLRGTNLMSMILVYSQ